MPLSFNRTGHSARRASSFTILSGGSTLGLVLVVGSFSLAVHAGQSRTAKESVYSADQAKRGEATYRDRCSACHGDRLGGGAAPPLTGDDFIRIWGPERLSAVVDKIRDTMPANDPGTLTRQQAADLVAYLLQSNGFPAGQAQLSVDEAVLRQITLAAAPAPGARPQAASASPQPPSFPPSANLSQLMRGMLFPTSNLIFNVQTHDPGARKNTTFTPDATGFSWVDWGADIYSPWELVDYAALAIAEAAPLMLTPGRRCENGRPVPVDRADWVKYTQELAEAGRAAYKASQSRSQEAVSEVSNQLAESCLNCHDAYRDKPGGTTADPSNKVARCIP